jgi:hypothetical protein
MNNGLAFEATVIGGAALIVLGTIKRATRDVDVLEPKIPEQVLAAARKFARARAEFGLAETWLNNGPESLARDLPPGWLRRRVPLFQGKAMKLMTLGRMDLLRSKLFAFLDRQADLPDRIAMKPTRSELQEIAPRLKKRDANEIWTAHVERSLNALCKERGHEPLF